METSDRLPTSTASEKALLGAILINPAILDEVGWLRPDMFHGMPHQKLYDAILGLQRAGVGVDHVSLGNALRARGELDKIGGESYLSHLALYTPGVDRAKDYAREVRESWTLRQIATIASDAADVARGMRVDTESYINDADAYYPSRKILADLQTALDSLDRGAQQTAAIDIVDVLEERRAQYHAIRDARNQGRACHIGVPTGFKLLDALTGGVCYGLVTVVGANTAVGKTAFVINVLDNATAAGIPAHLISLEDMRGSTADRLFAKESGVATTVLRAAQYRDSVETALLAAVGRMRARKWLFSDQAMTVSEAIAVMRRSVRKHGTKLFVIDYLHMLEPDRGFERQSEEQQLRHAMGQLHRFAKNLSAQGHEVAILAPSQHNRKWELRKDHRPTRGDLLHGEVIAQKCKQLWQLDRPALHLSQPERGIDWDPSDPEDREPNAWEWKQRLNLHVNKNTFGPSGVVIRLQADMATNRITDWSPRRA